ncbi:DUF2155 domain-containing protein [Henriciella barbarensis]|nr:DUF2155 domain-containing protein [Henriciella barbarensis]
MKRLFCTAAMAALTLGGATAQGNSDLEEGAFDAGAAEDDAFEEEEQASSAPTYSQEQMATLRALDKITGRSADFEIEVGAPIVFGVLEIDLKVCFQTPPEEPPESAAFLQIKEADYVETNTLTKPRLASEVRAEMSAAETSDESPSVTESENEPAGPLFSGWMFASTPGLSALEHPVYDVWVIRCRQPSPDSLSSPVVPDE